MATQQTIRKFFDRAIQREFSRDFLFRVGSIVFENGDTFNEDDLVYAKSAQLPGRAIQNVTAPYMGLDFNVPGKAIYTNSAQYSVTFYCDAESNLHQRFEKETRRLFDDATSTGDYKMPSDRSIINLMQIDKQLNPIINYKLIGASVRDCGSMEYKMAAGSGEVMEFTAVMSYHFYETERVSGTAN
jgi:hypothetical protein